MLCGCGGGATYVCAVAHTCCPLQRNAAREADAPTKRRRGGGMMDVFGLDSEDESDGEGND